MPDQAAYGSGGMVQVRNVLPAPSGRGYLPFPSAVTTDADLPGEPRGGIIAEVAGGSSYTYVGTQTAIYARTNAGWSNVSKPGGYVLGADDRWEFVQYQNKLIAVCGSAAPMQVNDVGGPAFKDLATSSRKPRAVHIGSINGWPVLGHTFDDQDGEMPSRLWWPRLIQVPVIEEWDPNLSTYAGYTGVLPQAGDGDIVKIIGGEVGIIVCERAIYRMRFVGQGADIFEIDRLVRGRGAISPGAVIDYGQVTYFIDRDGFYAFDGQSDPAPIGHGKVNDTLNRRMNAAAISTIVSAVVPETSVILFALPLDGAIRPNYVWAYAPKENRFTEIELASADIRETAIPGISWDEEPWASRILDEAPWSSYIWDDPSLMGGGRVLTLMGYDGTVQYLSGAGMAAILETEEGAPNEPMVSEVTEVRPVIDGAQGDVTVSVGSRMSIANPVTWTQPSRLNRIGQATMRARGVYVRARLNLPSGFTQAIGLSFDARDGGLA